MDEIVGRDEYVVVDEKNEALVESFRDLGLNAYVNRLPFGLKLPKSLTDQPSELILVGGSVSFEFAVPVLLVAHKMLPDLKYVHLTADKRDHFSMPEEVDYEIVLECPTKQAEEYKCQIWTDNNFERLKEITRQSDFHYYLRSFYKRNGMISRRGYTLIKYFGGIHDGETTRMDAPPQALLEFDSLLGRIVRQDGTGVDVYVPKINEGVLEFHFDRTERK